MKNTLTVNTSAYQKEAQSTSLSRQLSYCLLTCIMALLMVLPAGMAEAARDCLYDQAGVLKPTEQDEVRAALQALEAKYKVRVAIVTAKNLGYADMSEYTAELRRKNYTDGANGNMLLVLDANRRKWQISTDAKMKQGVVDNEYGIKAIKNAMLPYLKKNEYGNAFKAYAATTGELLAYAKDSGHAHRKSDDFSLPGLIAGIVMALGGGRLVDRTLRGQMTNIEGASQASHYLKKDSFVLNTEKDQYLYSTTMVVPRSQGRDNDCGGGGDSGGGSDGGGGGGGDY